MPRKKFIDKKNATTFYLGHRSQKDPLVADETAPQRVLIPLDQLPSTSAFDAKPTENKIKRKEEQKKYGIYYDDDYDYMQHLKDSREVSNIEWDFCERIYAPSSGTTNEDSTAARDDAMGSKLKLPSSVFGSQHEENIGLLNKAAPVHGPRPDLDPDVIAALDEDFDFQNPENELEDNFIELANGGKDGLDEITEDCEIDDADLDSLFSSDDDDYKHEARDEITSLKECDDFDFSDEEAEKQTRFTNYSMSSSVIRRNKQLVLVDDRFEKIFEEYDDNDIGALDCDDIEGDINPQSDILLKYAEEFEKSQEKEEHLNEKIAQLAFKEDESDCSSNEFEFDSDENPKEKFDCESILSTYSTTKNRPKIIKEKSNKIRINPSTGMPMGVLGKGLTANNLRKLDEQYDDVCSRPIAKSEISTLSFRPKNETSEERSLRKKSVKEYRRARREERKANQEAFKDEKKRQIKIRLNNIANTPALKL